MLPRPLMLASKIGALPVLSRLSPSANREASAADRTGYLECQRLAFRGVKAVEALLTEGMSERQAADLLDTWIRDNGAGAFFHKSFVWYGDRTRFEGVKTYFDYLPSGRVLRPGEIVILDVAPIHKGYVADIGYTTFFGDHPARAAVNSMLKRLYAEIPAIFAGAASGGAAWEAVDALIRGAGYDNIHALYPFSVLGHRVHRVSLHNPRLNFINFGWQSYWEFLSRGLFGQLLNRDYAGDLTGLWAIEPHIGGEGYGAKFEEILVVDRDGARWLDPEPKW